MFIDFAQTPEDRPLEADLCIVGTGAAGITLATEFIGHPCRVLLVESGGELPEAATTDLYRAGMAPGGKLHAGVHEGRARVLGGTTTLWGGQARELERIDFEPRPWVANSGWPFPADELNPFHERAGTLMGLRDVTFGEDIHAAFGVRRPAFDPAVVTHIYSRWSPQPNFATTYRQRLAEAENVQVVMRTNVTQIVPERDGSRVESLELRNLGGQRRVARAKTYVVCCGGIETPRLLLASNRVQSAGVGNAHDLVGRFFQDHLAARWAEFVPRCRAEVNTYFSAFFRGRTKYSPLMVAGEVFQRQSQTLNISAAVVQDPPRLEAGTETAKRVFRAVRSRRFDTLSSGDARRLLSQGPEILRFAYRVGVQRRTYLDPWRPLFLGSTIEQEPHFHSRVRLGSEADALGMPRVVMDWRLTPLVGKTLRAFAGALRDEFHRADLGTVKLFPWLLADDEQCLEHLQDVYHHMGTTRMHSNPRLGVVDPDCRVHGLDNLYLASSSVFPTGGHSNPTFTLLLLCLRLADRLKRSL